MTANNLFIYTKQAFLPAKLVVLLSLTAFFFSCGNKEAKETAKPTEDSAVVYYPINNYIRQQIEDVDSTPYFLYRLTVIGSKKDSSVISRATFDAATGQFLLPELEYKAFSSNFTEAVYEDESTNSITLTYTPKNKTNIVQNASVLLDKENQGVKWIFINTFSSNSDSTVIRRIGWKGNKSCYIIKSVSYPDKKETEMQTSFVWNDREEKE